MKYAIIGGTGVYSAGISKKEEVKNEYGTASVDIVTIDGEEICFLARHGSGHSLPPHLINYRANIKALKDLGVEYIYSTCAVGSMNLNYKIGDVVIINDFIEFTKARQSTFFDGSNGVKHIKMDEPYCNYLIEEFRNEAKKHSLKIKGDAVYITTEGPRFETASEISFYKNIGGDVVGMTNYPEVVLAKELGMCYSAIGIITNWCTGMSNTFSAHDIETAISKNKEKIIDTCLSIFKNGLNKGKCQCDNSIIEM